MPARSSTVRYDSVLAAAKAGHRQGLEAMRDKLAAAMDLAEPAVVAQVAGRLQAVLKELAEMHEPEASALDDLAARRAGRGIHADAAAPAVKHRP